MPTAGDGRRVPAFAQGKVTALQRRRTRSRCGTIHETRTLKERTIPLTFPASLLSDRYRVVSEAGRGGMATVYLAEDLKHGRRVALKVMTPDVGRAVGTDRFLREIQIAARLNHPHIVPLFDSGSVGGFLYFVMPYVEGESLRARLDRERQIPLDDAIRLTREIAAALGHAHRLGVAHCDIKPENVLLSDGMALVADFGVAQAIGLSGGGDESQTLTGTPLAFGTPRYMSPEQATGGAIDGRTDLYGLGCVLFEMLSGQPPFTASAVDALIRAHLTEAPPAVSDLAPGVPVGVSRVIARALAKSAEDRYASAARLVEALAAAIADRSTTSAPDVRPPAGPHNLPKQRTRFIGREKDRQDCARLLAETQLLTLTGIGGCGKTRLALTLAESALDSFPGGAWFVDLAPLTDGARVAEAVAQALSVSEAAGRSLTESLAEHVRGTRLLLVLDNCEHVLSDAAAVLDLLLGASDDLRVVATSREGIGLEGERLYAVRSLTVPPAGGAADRTAFEASEAVRLFVDRAQLAVRSFELTDANAAAVAEICRRLDGIPLAIELAAVRVKLLSPEQIRARLDDRFRLLTGGARGAVGRHQTLLATIQWSYDQLEPEEQRLFRLLSVFAGGWTLGLATQVVGPGADEFEIVDLLGRLVDKSLVQVERQAAEPRYRLLETVRQYARDRLVESGEADTARARHYEACRQLAEQAYEGRMRAEAAWAHALEGDHDNLRAALEFARGSNPEQYLDLAGALAWFWQARSYLLEGHEHLTTAITVTAPGPPRPSRARGLWGAAMAMAWQGAPAEGLGRMREALAMWRTLGHPSEVALALDGIGMVEFLGGEDESACVTLREALRLYEAVGDPVLINRGRVSLAQVLVALEQIEEVRELAAGLIAFGQAHADPRCEHSGFHYLADCALIAGECGESLELYRRSLAQARALGDRIETSFEVQGVGMSLAGLGAHDLALRLAAAVQAEWARLGADISVRFWDRLLARYFDAARAALGAEAAARAEEEGRKLPFDAAVTIALEAGNPQMPDPSARTGPLAAG